MGPRIYENLHTQKYRHNSHLKDNKNPPKNGDRPGSKPAHLNKNYQSLPLL